MNNLKLDSKELFEIIENYFTPLSCNIIPYNDKQNFLKKIEKENCNEQIIIHNLIDKGIVKAFLISTTCDQPLPEYRKK